MNIPQRIELLARLGAYMAGDDEAWKAAKNKAYLHNGWFLPAFIDIAAKNIANNFLQADILAGWLAKYPSVSHSQTGKTVGIVMAGNIPLVGFHDFMCVFAAGHRAAIKASGKDEVLIKHLTEKLAEWAPELADHVEYRDMLKGCDAYIATGSNNSAGYFDYYFGKYPHIIRRNRTSVAILTGDESTEELDLLADDVHLYYGMGCRNVTKLLVPYGYDFEPLLNVFKKYNYLGDESKYKNNYDYNLALHILNNRPYMSTPALILVEDESIFSPVSQLHYEFYNFEEAALQSAAMNDSVQCIVGKKYIPFGQAQCPAIDQYADAVDTMEFLCDMA
ncbi:MAG: acyl-CoA reductase [Niabella sp.]